MIRHHLNEGNTENLLKIKKSTEICVLSIRHCLRTHSIILRAGGVNMVQLGLFLWANSIEKGERKWLRDASLTVLKGKIYTVHTRCDYTQHQNPWRDPGHFILFYFLNLKAIYCKKNVTLPRAPFSPARHLAPHAPIKKSIRQAMELSVLKARSILEITN